MSKYQDLIELFHTGDYIEKVREYSQFGTGYLDGGDTPSFIGMYEAASSVAGSVTDAIDRIMAKQYRRAFSPIAGLHHARRHIAAGFCVFNDCGIAIEYLRQQYGIKRVAYIDIDAHHGDGVFYSFEDDPDLLFADIHQDGRTLYPGSGFINEYGGAAGQGYTINLPLPPHTSEQGFDMAMEQVIMPILDEFQPEIIINSAGQDNHYSDPITNMNFTAQGYARLNKY